MCALVTDELREEVGKAERTRMAEDAELDAPLPWTNPSPPREGRAEDVGVAEDAGLYARLPAPRGIEDARLDATLP